MAYQRYRKAYNIIFVWFLMENSIVKKCIDKTQKSRPPECAATFFKTWEVNFSWSSWTSKCNISSWRTLYYSFNHFIRLDLPKKNTNAETQSFIFVKCFGFFNIFQCFFFLFWITTIVGVYSDFSLLGIMDRGRFLAI